MSSKDGKIQAETLLADRWRRHTEALSRMLPASMERDDEQEVPDTVDVVGRLRSWIATWDSLARRSARSTISSVKASRPAPPSINPAATP